MLISTSSVLGCSYFAFFSLDRCLEPGGAGKSLLVRDAYTYMSHALALTCHMLLHSHVTCSCTHMHMLIHMQDTVVGGATPFPSLPPVPETHMWPSSLSVGQSPTLLQTLTP